MNNQKIEQAILEKADAFLDEIADTIFTASQEKIVENGSMNEGTLLKSGFVNRKFLEKEVGYSAPYAAHVEFGTIPHMPPVEPLKDWAEKRLGFDSKKAQSVAWAIAKKIEKEGTDPKPFFRPAINKAVEKYGGN